MTMTTQIEVTFEPHGRGDTLVTVVHSGFPVPEIRDFFESEVWSGALLRIATFLERSERHLSSDGTAAVLMLDIDRFKSVNDRHGHAAGDVALVAFAAAVRAAL